LSINSLTARVYSHLYLRCIFAFSHFFLSQRFLFIDSLFDATQSDLSFGLEPTSMLINRLKYLYLVAASGSSSFDETCKLLRKSVRLQVHLFIHFLIVLHEDQQWVSLYHSASFETVRQSRRKEKLATKIHTCCFVTKRLTILRFLVSHHSDPTSTPPFLL